MFQCFNSEYGLNLQSGGHNGLLSEESKAKISKAKTGKKGHLKWVGKKHSQESKNRMRLSHINKSLPESTKKNMRKPHKYSKRKGHSLETKQKMRISYQKRVGIHFNSNIL